MEPAFVDTATTALLSLPLFHGCAKEAMEDAAAHARVVDLAPGSELSPPERIVLVVLKGSVLVRSGVGPLSVLEPGSTLNEATLLTGAGMHPPEFSLKSEPCNATIDGLEATCIGNLCPHSPGHRGGESQSSMVAPRVRGQLTVTGAPRPGKRSPLAGKGGGATLAALSLELLKECLAERNSLEHFNHNHNTIVDRWQVLVRSNLLPGASNEILFAVTEVSERREIETGQVLFEEGQLDDTLFLVDGGEATVEKRVFVKSRKSVETVTVGSISRCAIIGDATLLCSKVPRCATARAKTPLAVVALPAPGFLKVLHRFPGITAHLDERIKETVSLLAEALPPKVDVLASLKLFATSDKMFLTAIAGASERHVYYCGDMLKQEGTADGTLYVVEFGACTVESRKTGVLTAVITAGSCMGERTLLGAENANATVKVATPHAMMLTVQQTAFNNTLRRFPWDVQRFHNLRDLGGGAVRHHDAAGLKLFEGCSGEFVAEITEAMVIRAFLPGQTVIVQGSADGGEMFAIKGGRVSIEVDGKPCVKLGTGDVFGELAMLGIVRRRASTVRAVTFCIMLEIPREAFLASIDRHPRERQRFEAFAMQHEVAASSVQWPILRGMPSQFLYLVNLYAERRICVAGDNLTTSPAQDAAIMVMQGSLAVFDAASGERVKKEILEGECFNVEALLGLELTQLLRPTSMCEVQILTKSVWEKVLTEFPEHREETRSRILREMAARAQERIEGKRDRLGVLRRSALFRSVSDEMAASAAGRVVERIVMPDETIVEETSKDHHMFWILGGRVQLSATCSVLASQLGNQGPQPVGRGSRRGHVAAQACTTWTWEALPGAVVSEAVVLGTFEAQPYTMKAMGETCLVQQLGRKEFASLLEEFPEDAGKLRAIGEEVKRYGSATPLQDRVMQCDFFTELERAAAWAFCQRVEDVFFAPGEIIFVRGDLCKLGSSCLYVLLAGEADVESMAEIATSKIRPGQIFGEAGAFGLTGSRSTTVRAGEHGLTHCARLQGHAVQSVVAQSPEVLEAVSKLFSKRLNENRAIQERNKQWLEDTVTPALAKSPIFTGFSRACLCEIATSSASICNYTTGQQIVEAGQPADSMLLLLEGSADVLSQHGNLLGTLTAGAMFGEVCLLSLLMLRTATIRASRACKLLIVMVRTVECTLAQPEHAASRAVFERLRQGRLDQVSRCMPLAGVRGIHASMDNMSMKVLSLQAERIHLPPGAVWVPLPASSPAGQYYGFLAHGHAIVQNPEEERPVMSLPEGCVLHESLVSKYGAHIRAMAHCEAYRLSRLDVELAAHLCSANGASWLCTLGMLLKESRKHMAGRLQSARGALNGSLPRKTDTQVRLWKLDREMNMDAAYRMRSFKEEASSRRKRSVLKRTAALMGVGGSGGLRRSSSSSNVLNRYPESGIVLRAALTLSGPTSPRSSRPDWDSDDSWDSPRRSLSPDSPRSPNMTRVASEGRLARRGRRHMTFS